ncbi:MAG: methyltransferase domain-containing protein [Candidatus Melainabacteria bacterium]|nr:methyltransferase domain-containing protein [Candidatus Melainabacteria bacterium]
MRYIIADVGDKKKEAFRLDELSSFYESEDGLLDTNITTDYSSRVIKKYLKGKKIVLMGIGDGYLIKGLSEICENLTVVEGSKELAKIYSEKINNCKIINSLFEEYNPVEKFDTLIGSHILEHVDNPVLVLNKVKNWIHKESLAIFAVPNAGSLHRKIGVAMGLLKKTTDLNEQDHKLGHRRVYTIDMFKEHLSSAGFKIQKMQGYMIKVVSNKQMQGWNKEFLDACYSVSLELPPEICVNIAAICTV